MINWERWEKGNNQGWITGLSNNANFWDGEDWDRNNFVLKCVKKEIKAFHFGQFNIDIVSCPEFSYPEAKKCGNILYCIKLLQSWGPWTVYSHKSSGFRSQDWKLGWGGCEGKECWRPTSLISSCFLSPDLPREMAKGYSRGGSPGEQARQNWGTTELGVCVCFSCIFISSQIDGSW